jgi:putative phosphoesterase
MRIAFISDVHSNLHALKVVLKHIEFLGVDRIYCCGDIVGYNAFPEECINLLREREIECVLGNHDWAVLTGDTSGFNPYGVAGVEYSIRKISRVNRLFLEGFKRNIRFNVGGFSFYLAHGSPRDNIFEYVFPTVPDFVLEEFARIAGSDVVVLGHTHVPMERRVDSVLFLNPGSVGQPRDGDPRCCFMVFDSDDFSYKWFRLEYDVEGAAGAVLKAGLPSFLAERLYHGY